MGASMVNQLACEGQPVNNNVDPTPPQEIREEQIIGQTFVAPRDGLNRIDILLQTYGRRNIQDVTLRLLEVPTGQDNPLEGSEVFQTSFNASTVRDQAWRTFSFPPVASSTGKTYLITLDSPESSPGNAITIGGIERDLYVPGGAFLGAVPVAADITFRVCFQMTPAEKLQMLIGQLTQDRPGVWGNSGFYGLVLGVYVTLLIGVFWKLSSRISFRN